MIVLGVISFVTGDPRARHNILLMVLLGIVLRYFRKDRASFSCGKTLQAMVNTTATVVRDSERQEIPLKDLVPADIVTHSAGDMARADVRGP